MANLYKLFENNKSLEKSGAPLQIDDSTFYIARSGSFAYRQLLSRLYKANRVTLESKSPAGEAKSDEILSEVLAKTVVTGWEGVDGRDGKPLTFTVENCRQLLLDLPDLRAKIEEAAGEAERYRAHVEDEDTKK